MKHLPTLIVDDSNMIVKIVKKALLLNQLKDFEFREDSIYTASDGMEAFEMVGKGLDIKLIITDINMPNLNGNELVEILQDTDKLKDVEVVFITSTSMNQKFSNPIMEKILGVIYKPFNAHKFSQLLGELYDEKKESIIKLKKIKEAQAEKKGFIYKVCAIYLEKYLNKVEISKDESKVLNSLIDEIFGDDNIKDGEFVEITHSILSTFIFEKKISHHILSKNILCIIKNSKNVVEIQEKRLKFIEIFESKIAYINSNKVTELKEILKLLTLPLLDAISIAFANVKNYPKLDSKLFSPYFKFIIDDLSEIDCLFVDDKLEKLMLEHREVIEFGKWIYRFIYNDTLSKNVKILASTPQLKSEVLRYLTKAQHQIVLLSKHYCGEIESYIWIRAKKSNEIVSYLKKNMPKTIPSTFRYLLHKNKISKNKLEDYITLEKQDVVVVSSDLAILKIFKDMIEPPLDKWGFFGYSKLSLLDVWLKSNLPDKIIIDYNFKSSNFSNGIEFFALLLKNYPIFKNMVELHNVYIIVDNNQLDKLHNYKKRYDFSIIDRSLRYKDIEDTLLYE